MSLRVPKRRHRDPQKGKSEYLRAAESLDQEVQHVKNLKRLSVGSIDLITDPDLSLRISDVEDTFYDAGLRTDQDRDDGNVVEEEEEEDYSNDTTSSSIDHTRVEYLMDSSQQDEEEKKQNGHGITGTWARGLGRARSLNGVLRRMGSLKERTLRGSRSMSNLKKRKSNEGEDEEKDVGETLLWVPADQHPSVKPGNYLELVKDTLEKIRDIEHEDKQEDLEEHKPEEHSNEANKENVDVTKFRNGKLRSSVVRRPSSLRKSYTEFSSEDLDLLDKALDNNRTKISRSYTSKRRLSLREITNELAKHSTKVGLTDDNAVTLARTLSIASAIDNEDDPDRPKELEHKDSQSVDTEEGFASNVFTNNHSLTSNMSSLKRSKFNTYRVKSPPLKGPVKLSNNKAARSSNLIARHTWESNSSNDGNDSSPGYQTEHGTKQESGILDSIDGPLIATVSDDEHDISINSFSQDSSMVSSDSTSHSILNRPDESISYISEKLDIDRTKVDQQSGFDIQTSNERYNSYQTRKSLEHKITGAKTLLNSKSQKLQDTIVEPSEEKVVPEKKERLDRRITNLFRRKKDKKLENEDEDSSVALTPLLSSEEKEESDQMEQTTIAAIRPISPDSTKGGTLISFTPTSDDGDSNGLPPISETFRSNDEVVEYVQELEDDSRDFSGSDILNDLNEEYNRHLEYSIDNSNDSVLHDQPLIETAEEQPKQLPKKLTFDDVIRPEKPNGPMEFTDSAFGFPLPPLTISTVIMCDHRLGINVERAIYRLSHLKLSDSNRELRQQVLLSNFMYAYLNLVNHTLYVEEAEQKGAAPSVGSDEQIYSNYSTIENHSDGTILIPEL